MREFMILFILLSSMNPSAEAIADSDDYADEGEPASRFVGIETLFGASPCV